MDRKQRRVAHIVSVTRTYQYKVMLPADATDDEILEQYIEDDPMVIAAPTKVTDMRVVRERVN